jgi:hypothetical protein
MIHLDKMRYSTRLNLMQFLSEICKKFFFYPQILSSLKVSFKDTDNCEYEEIVIFSVLLNIFKTDQLIAEYENKKLVTLKIFKNVRYEEQ